MTLTDYLLVGFFVVNFFMFLGLFAGIISIDSKVDFLVKKAAPPKQKDPWA